MCTAYTTHAPESSNSTVEVTLRDRFRHECLETSKAQAEDWKRISHERKADTRGEHQAKVRALTGQHRADDAQARARWSQLFEILDNDDATTPATRIDYEQSKWGERIVQLDGNAFRGRRTRYPFLLGAMHPETKKTLAEATSEELEQVSRAGTETALQQALQGIQVRKRAFTLTDKLPHHHAVALKMQITAGNHEALTRTIDALETIRPPLRLDADYDELSNMAEDLATEGRQQAARYAQCRDPRAQVVVLDFALKWAEARTGWTPPRGMTANGIFVRLSKPAHWRRQLKRRQDRDSVQAARVLQMLGHGRISKTDPMPRNEYLPADVVRRRHQAIDRNEEWMSRVIITDGSKLMQLRGVCTHAKEHQLAELKIRLIARQVQNDEADLEGRFITRTLPSRFHSTYTIKQRVRHGKKHVLKKWSVQNPRFNPTLTPEDAFKWDTARWTSFRGRMAARGFRFGPGRDIDVIDVPEPHGDATPHFHTILWARPDIWPLVEDALRDLFLYSDESGEPGARERRIKIEKPRKAHAIRSYLLKSLSYTVKTLSDGTETKYPAAQSLYTAVEGHRGIRMSNDGATIWRILRRVPDGSVLPEEIQKAWIAGTGDENRHCTPKNYLAFLRTPAPGYKKAWLDTTLHEIKYKNWNDYLSEAGGDLEDAYNLMQNSEGEERIKSRKRRLNRDGDPYTPTRPDRLFRWIIPGVHAIISEDLGLPRWHDDSEASEEVRKAETQARKAGASKEGIRARVDEKFNEISSSKMPGLHLSVFSQGGLRPLEPRAAADSARAVAEWDAFTKSRPDAQRAWISALQALDPLSTAAPA